MSAMAYQITSLTIVYSTVYSGTYQRKHQSSASLAFVRGIHRWPANSPHKGPVTRKNVFIWWRHQGVCPSVAWTAFIVYCSAHIFYFNFKLVPQPQVIWGRFCGLCMFIFDLGAWYEQWFRNYSLYFLALDIARWHILMIPGMQDYIFFLHHTTIDSCGTVRLLYSRDALPCKFMLMEICNSLYFPKKKPWNKI